MNSSKPKIGVFNWADLTVKNAEEVRDFYSSVVGWKPEAVPVGDYQDYNMKEQEGGQVVAGICHKKGSNAGLPSQWLVYITVEDLQKALDRCIEQKGKVIKDIVDYGTGKYAVIQDPAGAYVALVESV